MPAACGSGTRGRWTLDASSTTHDLYSRSLANDTLLNYANCPSPLETQAPTGGLGFGSTDSNWMLFTTATMHAGCLARSCGATQPDLWDVHGISPSPLSVRSILYQRSRREKVAESSKGPTLIRMISLGANVNEYFEPPQRRQPGLHTEY
jgi:hypothetical protein